MKLFKSAFLLAGLLLTLAVQPYGQESTKARGVKSTYKVKVAKASLVQADTLEFFQESPYAKKKATKKEDFDCRYANCKIKIDNLKAEYQPWVNANCKTKSFRITCCNYEGEMVVLWIVLSPTNPKCKYPHVFEHFRVW